MNMSDIFIIGGGINGTAIAADAASRGLSVTLCEAGDLGAGTSSASSKLIHGGLRYLELFEWRLVRKALIEREILMKRAPHLIQPLEFILPHEAHLRSAYLIRIGLFIYDHLAKRRYLPASKQIQLQKELHGFYSQGLLPNFDKGFSYYDCLTDDARLVILNALSAKENKAIILTRTQFISAIKENNVWKIQVKDLITETIHYYFSKVLINVAGPWVKEVNQLIISDTKFDIELVKGSHFVVPKLYEGDFAYILQNKDNRIVFAIPYQNQFTLIGTTDIIFKENLNNIKISEAEIIYLCDLINQYFKKSIKKSDIQWSYSGVRCLQGSDVKNPSKISRDYEFFLENDNNCILLTVIGGKLTTHRILAKDAINQLNDFFTHMKVSQTHMTFLPGGDIPNQDVAQFKQKFKKEFPWLAEAICERYVNYYGTRAYLVLNQAKSLQDLGIEFGAGLFQKEVEYLMQYEWAQTIEDILWRRTKLGLFFSEEEKIKLQEFINIYQKVNN